MAKGVLHPYLADFDAFLTELVLDRVAQVKAQAAALRDVAGTGTVAGNLTGALTTGFDPVMVAVVVLVVARDELRSRLRAAGTARFRSSVSPRPRSWPAPCAEWTDGGSGTRDHE